jgi:hypothetical protein
MLLQHSSLLRALALARQALALHSRRWQRGCWRSWRRRRGHVMMLHDSEKALHYQALFAALRSRLL